MHEHAPTSTEQIWYEDFEPGTVLQGALRRITVGDLDAYAAVTGETHPVHMDDDFAREAGFAGRIPHGLFNLRLIEGLKTALGGFDRSVVASLAWTDVRFSATDMRFSAPFYPRESVRLRLEFVSRRETSKPDRGLATERGVLVKEDGTEVVRGDHLVLLRFRPSAGAAS